MKLLCLSLLISSCVHGTHGQSIVHESKNYVSKPVANVNQSSIKQNDSQPILTEHTKSLQYELEKAINTPFLKTNN